MGSREKAKELMRHYFDVVRPGTSHGDGGAELDEMVDAIIDAAVEQVRYENRRAQAALLERRGPR